MMAHPRLALVLVAGALLLRSGSLAQWSQMSGPLTGSAGWIVELGGRLVTTTPAGIFVSDDGGDSWRSGNAGLPDSSATAVGVLGGDVFVGTGSDGVYVSHDHGANWKPFGLARTKVNALVATRSAVLAGTDFGVFRSAPDTSFWLESDEGMSSLGVQNLCATGDTVFASTSAREVFRSVSGGVGVWRMKHPPAGIRDFVLLDSVLLAATDAGLVESPDLGGSWVPLAPPPVGHTFTAVTAQGKWLLAGTSGRGIFRYDPGASTWAPIDSSLPGYKIRSFHASGSVLWVATEGGIFRSNDEGRTWVRASGGLRSGIVGALLVSGDTLYAGSAGVYFTTDRGEHWQAEGMPGYFITGLRFVGKTLLAAGQLGVRRSTDRGWTWNEPDSALPMTPVLNYMTALETVGDVALAAVVQRGAYRSTDEGRTWKLTTSADGLIVSSFTVLGNTVYSTAGRGNGVVMASVDTGATWSNPSTTPDFYPYWIMAAGGKLIAWDIGNRFFYSDDKGVTWVKASAPSFGYVAAGCSAGNHLFAGSSWGGGLLHSSDLGLTWHRQDSNLPSGTILSMAIQGDDLIAGVSNFGLWRCPLKSLVTSAPVSPRESIPASVTLAQNYPNPFNPTTVITYTLTRQTRVRLVVYDLLGREVATLVDELQLPGAHGLRWSPRGLPSGVYYYRLTTGDASRVRKMIYLQ